MRPTSAWTKLLCILAFAVLVASASPASAETWREMLDAVLEGERKDPEGEIVDREGALEDQHGAREDLPNHPDSPDRTASVPESRPVTRQRIQARKPQVLGVGVAEVAAQSPETVDVEVVTSEPMLVYINGEAVEMRDGEFGFAKAMSGSNRLRIVHETDKASAYRLFRGESKVATKVASPRNGENGVDFEVSVDAGDTLKVDVEGSPVLFDGEATFGFYHVVKDREHTIPIPDEWVEILGLGCREITVRSKPYQTPYRSGFRRWYRHWVELEASLCGTPSSNGAVDVNVGTCGGVYTRLRAPICWFGQNMPTAAGTVSLRLGFRHTTNFDSRSISTSSRKKDDLSRLPRWLTKATIRLEKE